MNKQTPRLFGFTLLELLVVISIIGILIAISVPAFAIAQRQSRNARRLGDLKAVQNCLEQFYVANSSTYVGGAAACVTGIATEPKPSGTAYAFTVAPTASAYTFCVYPENISTGVQSTGKCASQLQ
ncbi:prepilin-type N-terminal cleavage/methylation domain-containing protein [Candidatus Woesebacteria bacterium]|nr:prepilin-type N-terminal cleavage/methylation domain-containing protein [Candidatus Woesebacteria bacterium]